MDPLSWVFVAGIGLAAAGAGLSPWLKRWFPRVFAPSKGGG